MRTESQQRAMQKQAEARKGKTQCNLGYVKPGFTRLLAEMRTGYKSNEACLYAAMIELKRVNEQYN